MIAFGCDDLIEATELPTSLDNGWPLFVTDPHLAVTIVAGITIGIATGFVWGRLGVRLAIPELFRMLATPLITGVLGLVLGLPLALIVFGAKIRDSPHSGSIAAAALGCFGAGVLVGVPGVFGWALGYRKPR